MLIHATMTGSRANGPGLRAVVFFQGCALACPGCQNPLTHPWRLIDEARGASCYPDELAEMLAASAPGVEGLTISGGEPMHQPVSLIGLLVEMKHRRPDWSVGLFTGYTEEELDAGLYHAREGKDSERRGFWRFAKQYLDWAVFGRYDRTRPSNAPMTSSANQSLVLFSDRYTAADFAGQQIEFSIGPEGLTQITGFPGV